MVRSFHPGARGAPGFSLGVLAGLVCGLLAGLVLPDERPAPRRPRTAGLEVRQDVVRTVATGNAEPKASPVAPEQPVTVPRSGVDAYFMLKGGNTPGLLEMARARAEQDIAARPNSRRRGEGWLSLVARFGDDAALDWIESVGGADRAFAEGAANPLAAARFAKRLQDPDRPLLGPYFTAFARENPGVAFDAAVRALPSATRHRERLVEIIGRTATADKLETVRAALGTVRPLEALRAIDLLHRRGVDVSGFRDLIRTPLAHVDAYRTGDDPVRVSTAITALRRYHVTRGDDAMAALRSLVDRGDLHVAHKARTAVAQLERLR